MSPAGRPESERRKHARIRFHEKVTVQKVVESKSGNVFEVQGPPQIVKAQDVSEGGIKLDVNLPEAAGQIIKLHFEIPKKEPVDIFTKLAWAGNGSCGLQFVMPDDQIRKWVKGCLEKNKE